MRTLLRALTVALVTALAIGCAHGVEGESIGAAEAAQTAQARIQASAGYLAASQSDRARINQVASATSVAANTSLAEVLEGEAARLFDRDKDGQSTLDNLLSLATSPSHPKIAALTTGFTTSAIVDAVFADIAHPEKIHQGPFNTCQITSIQFALAIGSPSEYVRILRGLTGSTGKVKMRKGGELELFTKYLVPKPNDNRSASEAIFQTTVMDEITGSYDPVTDRSKLLFFSYPGNSTHMAEKTFENLFGREFDVKGQSDLQVVMNPRSTMDKEEALQFLRSLSVQKEPAIVDAVLEGLSNSHSLVVMRIEGDRIFLRNPWGPQKIAHSSGQLEDRDRSIYSMTLDELAGQMQTYIAPR
jgi:hypothetical protein